VKERQPAIDAARDRRPESLSAAADEPRPVINRDLEYMADRSSEAPEHLLRWHCRSDPPHCSAARFSTFPGFGPVLTFETEPGLGGVGGAAFRGWAVWVRGPHATEVRSGYTTAGTV